MSEKPFLTLAAVAAVASYASCNYARSEELEDCASVISKHFGGAPRSAVEAFTQSDLETKYRIYLCGNQVLHPPALYLAEAFADGGAPIATFLQRKLAETSSDATVRDIVRVYAEMQRQGTYEVKSNVQLMKLLGDRVAAIRDEYWRNYCAEILSVINGASGG